MPYDHPTLCPETAPPGVLISYLFSHVLITEYRHEVLLTFKSECVIRSKDLENPPPMMFIYWNSSLRLDSQGFVLYLFLNQDCDLLYDAH